MLNSGRGQSYNHNNWEAETGGFLSVQSHPRPYSKFQTSLVYSVKPCLQLKTKNKKQEKKSILLQGRISNFPGCWTDT